MNVARAINGIDLAGVWSLREAGTTDCIDMTVPGDGISALVAAGRLGDPYVGRNEY